MQVMCKSKAPHLKSMQTGKWYQVYKAPHRKYVMVGTHERIYLSAWDLLFRLRIKK
jgi:hypothetical protein